MTPSVRDEQDGLKHALCLHRACEIHTVCVCWLILIAARLDLLLQALPAGLASCLPHDPTPSRDIGRRRGGSEFQSRELAHLEMPTYITFYIIRLPEHTKYRLTTHAADRQKQLSFDKGLDRPRACGLGAHVLCCLILRFQKSQRQDMQEQRRPRHAAKWHLLQPNSTPSLSLGCHSVLCPPHSRPHRDDPLNFHGVTAH